MKVWKTHWLLVSVALVLAGCVTPRQREDASVAARSGADERLQRKIERGRRLSLDDVIELSREGVSDSVIERAVNRSWSNYHLKKDDIDRLENAGVSSDVIDAMLDSGDGYRGSRGYYNPRHYGYGYGGHYGGYRRYGHYGGYRHFGHRGHYGHHGYH